jgi:hypothetical protein
VYISIRTLEGAIRAAASRSVVFVEWARKLPEIARSLVTQLMRAVVEVRLLVRDRAGHSSQQKITHVEWRAV